MATTCTCGCGHEGGARARGRYTAESRVGEAAADAAGRAVLERFGLNHCCSAGLSLREGAAAAGARVDDVVAALNAAVVATA